MSQSDEPISTVERRPLTKDIDVVDLNTATAEELSRLPGIGDKLAGRIIEYRAKVHPFRETAEIAQVRGISAAMYTAIADLLTVGPAEPEEPEPEAEPQAPQPAAEPKAVAEEPEPVVEAEMPAPPAEPEAPAARSRELPPVPPPPRPRPAPESKRGAGWLALLAVGLASAIAGACLALLLLFVINGTLRFGPNAAVSGLEARARQLDSQASQLTLDLSRMQGRLDEVDSRVAAAQAELRAVNEEMARVGGDVGAFQGRIGALEAELGGLAGDLQAVRQSARRFDAFLAGLRELLEQAQGPKLDVTPLPQAPSPTRKPGLTVVPQPTSTPRP
ncbi:MAG: helix-hairpin-helix domain-containing protein [Anaerolineae bacterium]|nr:helix-hairpin-helix domain-containing protein [Anaerolineae bacterium]